MSLSGFANIFPSQWPRTLNVLGLGSLFLVALGVTNSNVAPASHLAPTHFSILTDSTQSTDFIASFLWIFVAYVLGEIFVTIGARTPPNDPEPLKLEARRLFAIRDSSGFWATRFQAANQRRELFSGLTVAVLLLSLISALNKISHFSWWNIFSALGIIIFGGGIAFLFSGLARDAYLEMDQSMNAISNVKKSEE